MSTTSSVPASATAAPPLVAVKNLTTEFPTDAGIVRAVNDVSLVIPQGKTVGLVGESGSGKSVTALSIIRLIASPGRIASGSIDMTMDGKTVDLTRLDEGTMRRYRGSKISMIFQEPMTSLNPVFTIGAQIIEAIRLHQPVTHRQAREQAIDMLKKVGVPDPHRRIDDYPHQMSGGQRQRVMIAMALVCRPQLLIADEPTTALDVTIQAQILELLRSLQAEFGMSVLIITHDLGIIAELADTVAVMYASKVVENTTVKQLFAQPLHPYTKGLLKSKPRPGLPKTERLQMIPGMVPSPLRFPTGCKFHPRCQYAKEVCQKDEPQLREIEPGHWARCHFAEELRNA